MVLKWGSADPLQFTKALLGSAKPSLVFQAPQVLHAYMKSHVLWAVSHKLILLQHFPRILCIIDNWVMIVMQFRYKFHKYSTGWISSIFKHFAWFGGVNLAHIWCVSYVIVVLHKAGDDHGSLASNIVNGVWRAECGTMLPDVGICPYMLGFLCHFGVSYGRRDKNCM